MAKILYIFERSDWKSRMPVARAAKDAGHEVVLALIGDAGTKVDGAEAFKTVTLEARAASFRMIRDLKAVIRAEQPDIIHAVTLKYAFITGLAAMPYKHTHKIYTLAGLGYLFRGGDAKSALLRAMTGPLLKNILTAPGVKLIFQNPDDRELMIQRRFARQSDAILIPGSGVDLTKFSFTSEPHGVPLVLMPTRLVHDKGVSVFVEAARILKKRGVNARFEIAGGETKHNPKGITRAEMEAMTADGAAQWLGRVEDMPGLLARAALIVYPSSYGEGLPRVLLEACAAGRAIVTTDHPGCREAVRHGENGLLVPVRNAQATAAAIEKLLQDPELRRSMGAKGRARAEKDFDVNIIAQKTAAVYKA